MKPVVSVIAYGLGNQLYQFAVGYALSRRLDCPLLLDISWYSEIPDQATPRVFNLPQLIGSEGYSIATYGRLQHLRDRLSRLSRLSLHRPYRFGVPVWSTGRKSFGEDFFALDAPRCITGVPGHYPFFEAVEPEIRRRILSSGPAERARARLPDLAHRTFVHVRRGDLVSSPSVTATLRSLGAEYYREAMQRYEDREGPTEFLVFSDDIRAAREAIDSRFRVEFAELGTEFEDFAAMAQCAGGVTANSSYSWWAAFLGRKRTVVAPREWGKVPGKTPQQPEEWMTI